VRASLIEGIPDEFRGPLWMLICRCNEQKTSYSSNLYRNLLGMPNEEDEFCIGKDLPRTLTFMKEFNIDPTTG
jgi:hypothetical protein